MEWTWLFVFIGLMYVMHRFGLGCCGSHNHSSHGHDGEVDGQDSETKPLGSSRKEEEEEFIGTGAVTEDGSKKRM